VVLNFERGRRTQAICNKDAASTAGPSDDSDVIDGGVSSDDLSRWLRDVDAGDLVMVVDACHSAASVEGSGFKPGPMGSRGLGQPVLFDFSKHRTSVVLAVKDRAGSESAAH
jgi:hypothetical protein